MRIGWSSSMTSRAISLNTSRLGPNKMPLFFGAVQIKKNYVSYHLFSHYTDPDLLDGLDVGLQQRMQGRTCFNFTKPDDAMVAKLADLTRQGFERFERSGLLRPSVSELDNANEGSGLMSGDQDQDTPRSKADLLGRIDAAWTSLQQFIDGTDVKQLTEPVDAEGWSVKDHLSHLAAWERSMLFLLQGRPRHEGLGVSEQLYLADDVDALNAAIHDQTKGRSLNEAVADLRTTHEQLIGEIEARSDTDLQQPYSYFLPNEPGEESGEPIMLRLAGNTYEHYEEHRDWMEAIVAQGA